MAFGIVKPPAWYWIVAVVALLWSLMGCFACYSQLTMSPADFARLPSAQQETWRSMPGWVKADYAVAVIAGLLGSLGLLMRRRWARPLYLVSLIAVVLQFGWVFLASPVLKLVGPSAIPFPALIVALAVLFFWFSGLAIRRAWVR
ncbi:hypothetical protein [Flavisphingomonas formosensis]|uniref:hypothetical protein n=1 Tax=Flavisphingomonas formosensis TaxID=861534 RepID=UPI0012F8A983|nr:hypothetical protein [Sphingomonas formosensis]